MQHALLETHELDGDSQRADLPSGCGLHQTNVRGQVTLPRADVLRIAAESGIDERTILRHLSGYPVREVNARLIEAAIVNLGIVGGPATTRGDVPPSTKRGE